MFENPRRGRQARNFTTNVPKILDLPNRYFPKIDVGCRPEIFLIIGSNVIAIERSAPEA